MSSQWVLRRDGPSRISKVSKKHFTPAGLTRAVSGHYLLVSMGVAFILPDTGSHVRLLPRYNFVLSSMLLTRAVPADTGTHVRLLFMITFHMFFLALTWDVSTDIDGHVRLLLCLNFKLFHSLFLRYGHSFQYDFCISLSTFAFFCKALCKPKTINKHKQ